MHNRPEENQETVAAWELTELQKRGIEARVEKNPVLTFMGIEVLEIRPGEATVLLRHREDFHNSLGQVQGGVVAVVADVAGGVSLYSVLPDPREFAIPTIEFKLNFLRPAGAEDLLARGATGLPGSTGGCLPGGRIGRIGKASGDRALHVHGQTY